MKLFFILFAAEGLFVMMDHLPYCCDDAVSDWIYYQHEYNIYVFILQL